MASVPDKIGNVALPKGKNVPATQPAYPAEAKLVTAFALNAAINRAGSNTITYITKKELPAKRMIDLKSSMSHGAMKFRNLDPDRSQNAEACLIQVYGTEKTDTESCASCNKGNGPFTKCVQLVQDGACGNCHYNSGASKCDFVRKAKRAGTPSLTTPRKAKVSRIENDFLQMIRGIRSSQLKLLGNALLDVAKKLDDVNYNPDKKYVLTAESESESDD